MANPDPTRKGDYRDVKNPKVMSRDILIWMVRVGRATYSSPEIAATFGITVADASCRLGKLRKWNCVRVAVKGKGPVPNEHRVTKWGVDCANRWEGGR